MLYPAAPPLFHSHVKNGLYPGIPRRRTEDCMERQSVMSVSQSSRQPGSKSSNQARHGAAATYTEMKEEEAVDLAEPTKGRDAFAGTHNKQPVVVHFESQMWKLFVSFQSRKLPLSSFVHSSY